VLVSATRHRDGELTPTDWGCAHVRLRLLYNVRHAARKVFFHLLTLLSNNTLHYYFRLTPRLLSSKKSSHNHASTRAKTSRVSCYHFLSIPNYPSQPLQKPRNHESFSKLTFSTISCGYDFNDNYVCENSSWNNWVRWVVLALVIIGFILLFLLFA